MAEGSGGSRRGDAGGDDDGKHVGKAAARGRGKFSPSTTSAWIEGALGLAARPAYVQFGVGVFPTPIK
jgi:hypothetical protein